MFFLGFVSGFGVTMFFEILALGIACVWIDKKKKK